VETEYVRTYDGFRVTFVSLEDLITRLSTEPLPKG